MNIELDRIYNMDCLEGMKAIPDGSVDAVICDLPYGTTQCPWDAVIPFEPLWKQYDRICKPNAAVILFGVNPFFADVINSNRKNFRYEIVWFKTSFAGFLNAEKCPLRAHENIAVFYRKLPTYNPQMQESQVPKRCTTLGSKVNVGIYGEKMKIENWEDTGYRYPIDVVTFKKDVKGSGDERHLHPTQKPVDLLRYLVRTYTNEGDTVLDNCMGSGTTAIACIKERRHFIGFELSKEYFDKAVRRIKAEQAQLTLF